jgi:hypothetical protein
VQVSALLEASKGARDRSAAAAAAARLARDLPVTVTRADPRSRAQVLLGVARILAQSDCEGEARDLLARLIEDAAPWPDVQRAAILARAEIAPRGGDFGEVVELLERVRGFADVTPRESHRLLLAQAQALAGLEHYDEALDKVAEAAGLAGVDEAVLVCERARSRGTICAFRRDWAASAEAFEEAAERAKSAGLVREAAANLRDQGDALVRMGDLARGYAVLHASLALAEESGSERIANFDRLLLAYLDAVDSLPGADEMLDSSLTNAEARGWTFDHLTGRFLLGRLHAQRGDMDAARRELLDVRERAIALGNRPLARDCAYELELLEPTLVEDLDPRL